VMISTTAEAVHHGGYVYEFANSSAVSERAECNQSSSRRVRWNCVWCFSTGDYCVADNKRHWNI